MITLPAVALIPDITYTMAQKIFWPTPTDAAMLEQRKNPGYIYDGFDDIFVPPLPAGVTEEGEEKTPKKKDKAPEASEMKVDGVTEKPV